MIVGIGVDILTVARMEKLYQRYQKRLLERILHQDEQAAFKTVQAESQARWLAKRWAVKEAAAKALGTGFRQSIRLVDFIYQHDPLGKPLLSVVDGADNHAQTLGIQAWHVSVSDEKEHIVAMVIAEK